MAQIKERKIAIPRPTGHANRWRDLVEATTFFPTHNDRDSLSKFLGTTLHTMFHLVSYHSFILNSTTNEMVFDQHKQPDPPLNISPDDIQDMIRGKQFQSTRILSDLTQETWLGFVKISEISSAKSACIIPVFLESKYRVLTIIDGGNQNRSHHRCDGNSNKWPPPSEDRNQERYRRRTH